jgi:hypothetical protein
LGELREPSASSELLVPSCGGAGATAAARSAKESFDVTLVGNEAGEKDVKDTKITPYGWTSEGAVSGETPLDGRA